MEYIISLNKHKWLEDWNQLKKNSRTTIKEVILVISNEDKFKINTHIKVNIVRNSLNFIWERISTIKDLRNWQHSFPAWSSFCHCERRSRVCRFKEKRMRENTICNKVAYEENYPGKAHYYTWWMLNYKEFF